MNSVDAGPGESMDEDASDGPKRRRADKQTDRQLERSDDLTMHGDCGWVDGHGGESSVPQTDNQTSS